MGEDLSKERKRRGGRGKSIYVCVWVCICVGMGAIQALRTHIHKEKAQPGQERGREEVMVWI